MSDFKFTCSGCGQHLSGDDTWRGMQITCPSCNAAIIVPQMASAPMASSRVQSTPVQAPPPIVPLPSGRPLPGAYAPAAAQQYAPRQISGSAVAALVLVVLTLPINLIGGALLHFPVGIITLLIGLYCAHSALGDIRANRNLIGMTCAVIALVLGYLMLLVSLTALAIYLFAPKEWLDKHRQRGAASPFPPITQPSSGPPQRQQYPPVRSIAPVNEPRVATNPLKVEIPASPVAGIIAGQTFSCDKVTLNNGWLAFSQQGKGITPELKATFTLNLKWGEAIGGKQIIVTSQATVPSPVSIDWHDQGTFQSEFIARNYVLRLEFGTQTGKTIPGKIYFESSASHKTKFAGTFEAQVQ